jgi:NAD(P)-dependent dehydrogenase (short-subunit alcohol dehydrogenase family)
MRSFVDTLPALDGKTIVVTGGNSGIGLAAARALAGQGATLVLACRDEDKARAAAASIRAGLPSARVDTARLDLSELASVREFAARFRDAHPRLDVLVNNAGVMAVPRTLTRDGFELQLGVNHLGHFALTGLLLDRLLAAPGARVVNVSSMASRMGKMHWDDLDGGAFYEKWLWYGQSKLANLLFTFELARRVRERGVGLASLACHPGYAATNLQFVGPQMERSLLGGVVMRVGNALFAQSAEAGAWPTLYAAASPTAKNGDFIGPRDFRQWRGEPTHVQARRLAHNPEQMQRLWRVSVERTGVDYAALG